ncbi:hypothetical protein [Flavobacterium sp. HTF]|uniref:hypothetical protein n=1 Tax=Flavobacterium sp. HTF TaxID=2170732 RepID=UPI000D5D822F|nr:hypothetical protein [Flavobacterium sp. HTF]PWB23844.1 hypothetical protein DCO46_13540 [Flavobacterium sp. HTF]
MHFLRNSGIETAIFEQQNLRVQIIENYRYKRILGLFGMNYFATEQKGVTLVEIIFFKIVINLIFLTSISIKILFLPFTKLILNGYLQ